MCYFCYETGTSENDPKGHPLARTEMSGKAPDQNPLVPAFITGWLEDLRNDKKRLLGIKKAIEFYDAIDGRK